MKKLNFALLLFITSIYIISSFSGCSDDNNPLIPVLTHKGVFVLYEGLFGQPQTYDYGFINLNNNNVSVNVFQNSNNGTNLNAVPDGIQVYGKYLFIASQGSFGQQGTIYKIDAVTNQLITSRDIGLNPYSLLCASNGRIFVTNTAGDYITVLDTALNIVQDNISVGSSPSEISLSGEFVYISKQSYTSENSLAIVNINNFSVSKLFFNTPPVCAEAFNGKIYVSTYSGKKIYTLNSASNSIIDSVDLNITEPALGYISVMNSGSLFFMGVSDTAFSSNVGKRVYKLDLINKIIDPNFNIQYTGVNDSYGMAYNISTQQLYVVNSKSGTANGEVNVYDNNGNLVKNYPDIGGKFPKKIAFLNL